jgi:hypothetical protein
LTANPAEADPALEALEILARTVPGMAPTSCVANSRSTVDVLPVSTLLAIVQVPPVEAQPDGSPGPAVKSSRYVLATAVAVKFVPVTFAPFTVTGLLVGEKVKPPRVGVTV